ncbi:MAG: sigma factor-like helix-turn-helix DNA-binding protein, partial [Bacteroidales bacterium]|nr:sigma factor-like helix-turn-helix DNA-binding protein [Bacteroidales bacterium]
YFREYSYEEIASEMNLPIGTVKVRLNRAKSLLYNIYLKTEKK